MRLLLLILAFLGIKIATAHALSEDTLRTEGYEILLKFKKEHWKQIPVDGERGVLLAGARFIHAPTDKVKGTIVVVPGRSEAYLKYLEVFYDLFQEGYDIYTYDHRGQGLSPHLSARNAQIGHIDRFNNYVKDLNTFTSTIVLPHAREPLYLLAHSMGGAIAAQFLENYPGVYTRAVLSAPMFDINTKPYPRGIAKAIVGVATFIGLGNRYAIGKGDYEYDIPIAQNTVTHSENRAWLQDQVTRENPLSAVGGPSNRWVKESLKASRKIERRMDSVATKILMFEAGEDVLVPLDAQERGCKAAADCTPKFFAGSKHEILMEKDSIRDQAKDEILGFFK